MKWLKITSSIYADEIKSIDSLKFCQIKLTGDPE
jgi:hypothetical protein